MTNIKSFSYANYISTKKRTKKFSGGIVMLEYKLFLNLRVQISVAKHKMVLQELTITLILKLDTILNLDWSNDLFPDDPAQIMNPSSALLPFIAI